jgi:hypothetical protein
MKQTKFEKTCAAVRGVADPDKLDRALDDILFAESKDAVLESLQ